ncbi:MAG: hypothetical protein MI921_28050 [Cytophagales bacterium]|nr:hypothetical protein [Cytophagales bacterium]
MERYIFDVKVIQVMNPASGFRLFFMQIYKSFPDLQDQVFIEIITYKYSSYWERC